MKIWSKKISNNLFLFPLILCFIQFCFVFVSLFKSGFDFAPTVLIVDLFLMLLWACLFVLYSIKFKSLNISVKNAIIFFAYIFASLYIVKYSWFSKYLRLDCINRLFDGSSFIDPIFHADIAESFITNGYPSIQLNAPTFLSYHTLSHMMVAGISKLFNLPCYVTYNYVYPVIAFPMLVYLFQKVVVIARRFLTSSDKFSFLDKIFMVLVVIGFNSVLRNQFFCDYLEWLEGESYCVSIILLFAYCCIADSGYRKIKNFDAINLFLLIPFFILLISYSKISTGFMFFVGISYFVFRKNLFANKKWLLVLFYALIFAFYYFVPNKFVPATNYPVPEESSGIFGLFHLAKTYIKYPVMHYALIFAPVVAVLLFADIKGVFSVKEKTPSNNLLILETLIITTIVGVLPGLILKMNSGNATYFEDPVEFFALIILIGMDIFTKMNRYLMAKVPKLNFEIKFQDNQKFEMNMCFVCFVCFAFMISFGWYERYDRINVKEMVKEALSYRLDKKTKADGTLKENLFKIFHSSEIVSNNDYKMYTEIRDITKKNKNKYCVFLAKEANFVKLYSDNYLEYGGAFLMQPYFATAAYTGLPVINAMYIDDTSFYRGDGYKIEDYPGFGYNLPPTFCGSEVTVDNMKETAKNLGKRYIVVIGKDGYEIVDVDFDQ